MAIKGAHGLELERMLISDGLGDGREHIKVELKVAHLGALVKGYPMPRASPERHQQGIGLDQRLLALGTRFAGGPSLLVLAVALRAHARRTGTR